VSDQAYSILTVGWRQKSGELTGHDLEVTLAGAVTLEPGDTYGSVFSRRYDELCAAAQMDGADPAKGFFVVFFDVRAEVPLA
jgi:hypothetical protein